MKLGITKSKFHFMMLHLLFSIFLVNAEPLVEIAQGILNGTTGISRDGNIFSAFLGIPYGLPPFEELRFASPVAAGKWTGIRQADFFRSICIQIDENNKIAGAEDCLYLNVYTPRLEFKSSSKHTLLPVMVWIHGGGYIWGSSNQYGPKYLLDKDVILVTLNFRLAIFGFLSTGDSVCPGNFGMKDQVLALKWVKSNIISFGGDPNQVTLFGESAGGACVALHAISKASTGLFQKYIIQSGPNLFPWAYQKRSNFIEYARDIATLVQCPWITSEGFLNCMRQISPEILLKTMSIFSTVLRPLTYNWTPTDEPDSEDAYLTDSPRNLIENNQMKDLPFMSGVVADEALVIALGQNSIDESFELYRANLDSIIDFIGSYYDQSLNLQTFKSDVMRFYFNNSPFSVNKTAFTESILKFTNDAFFFYPQLKMLQIVTRKIKSPSYFYNFGYRGRLSIYSNLENNTLKCGHMDELIYLFDLSLFSTTMSDLNLTNTEIAVSRRMVDMWTSFATDGKPTSSVSSDIWLPYTTQNKGYFQIGNIENDKDPTMRMSYEFYTDRMNFWMKNAPIRVT
ncbi:esterase FE4-like isoform X2 [Belonocnema kinseyi]|uniref:esterase FE4-like isoform X2 n=1 Tax=Belonocnema kinseyi TaxID=2817044 RepID=UPI00143D1689|nr:esterase FE4-like isoform X2 [Belonocnema kinseyi]